jgi:ribosome maturation protein SDO1
MVTVDEAVIARYEKGGKRFEILVDPELAYQFREGKGVNVNDLLAVDKVFKDAKKGESASENDILSVFGTTSIEDVVKHILKEGDIQLTTEFRRKKLEEKTKQIADFISRNAIDPRTKTAIPVQRILNAMEQAKVHIDVFKSVEEQIENVIKSIRELLPLSFEKIRLEVRIPPQFAPRCYGILKSFNASIQYTSDGSLIANLEIPAGLKGDFYDKINSVTHGNVTIKEADQK